MKQPKKLTREQKMICTANNLKADDWMFVEETDFNIKVVHKVTGKTVYIDKFIKKRDWNRCILREDLIKA